MGEFDSAPNSGQLSLPLITLRDASSTDRDLARNDRVYVNRNLQFSQIEWCGFDMDYTLAIYQQAAMDSLSVELTTENLIKMGYPRYLRKLPYDTRFPIRGLLIDKRHGNVLKMNCFNAVHKGYHGFRRLDRQTLSDLYWKDKLRYKSDRYHRIDTLFGLSEVTSYASIIEVMDRHNERVDYAQLFEDIRRAIDLAHAEGTVHRKVLSDLPGYVERDAQLAQTLHRLRSSGKKLFLLTNSPWPYTNSMMSYLLDGVLPQYDSWRLFFDVVMVSAGKPRWFDQPQPFSIVDEKSGTSWPATQNGAVKELRSGRVYAGGNLEEFERLTGLSGSSTLYIGDHIYGDILRSKKQSVWRTAMIIPELDAELGAHQRSVNSIRRKIALEQARTRQQDERRFYRARLDDLASGATSIDPAEPKRIQRAVRSVDRMIRQMNTEQEALEQRIDGSFHPYWGSLLKEHGELSSFGAQVERYADIYMRRVSCMRHYPDRHAFLSPHDFMPHEL